MIRFVMPAASLAVGTGMIAFEAAKTVLAQSLSANSLVSIGSAVVVCAAVAHGAFWLAVKLQRIEDTLAALHKRVDGLPCPKQTDCDLEKQRP